LYLKCWEGPKYFGEPKTFVKSTYVGKDSTAPENKGIENTLSSMMVHVKGRSKTITFSSSSGFSVEVGRSVDVEVSSDDVVPDFIVGIGSFSTFLSSSTTVLEFLKLVLELLRNSSYSFVF